MAPNVPAFCSPPYRQASTAAAPKIAIGTWYRRGVITIALFLVIALAALTGGAARFLPANCGRAAGLGSGRRNSLLIPCNAALQGILIPCWRSQGTHLIRL